MTDDGADSGAQAGRRLALLNETPSFIARGLKAGLSWRPITRWLNSCYIASSRTKTLSAKAEKAGLI